jgi:hypothetical protein
MAKDANFAQAIRQLVIQLQTLEGRKFELL